MSKASQNNACSNNIEIFFIFLPFVKPLTKKPVDVIHFDALEK